MVRNQKFSFPRVILAGLKGGSGKTLVSLGLTRAYRDQELKIKPFKKGPDYIDAKWLSLAAGQAASNLDPFIFPSSKVQSLFWSYSSDFDLALIEGNRGLFDGKDVAGSYSTAELARLLEAPIILVADCTKVTRTMAAIVMGCKLFEPDLNLAGIILNQTAGDRHRKILCQSIEKYTDIPVLGALPRMRQNPIPERHMGLISDQEYQDLDTILNRLAKIVKDYVDIDKILKIARDAKEVEISSFDPVWPETSSSDVVIGVVRDASLWFYYEENIKALEVQGAKVVSLSILDDSDWPEIHALYLGGGFPETMAGQLEANTRKRALVKNLAEKGMPIYAECGGFMYLCQNLFYDGLNYTMTGVLPVQTKVHKKPQGHGYVQAEIILPNPFYKKGQKIVGHEFHYSDCPNINKDLDFALHLNRGVGMCDGMDGLLHKNVLASYAHIHALGTPDWAKNFVLAAEKFKQAMDSGFKECPRIVVE
ncbi:hydrogenobyrinic acid a,c-diamide synthase (glutamine-hydrolyzing) [Desulfohalobiaceae bacterium Ax17]|uniref:cobyrinate a,c-diamide synthase n=1 Tax=Desulfovulcanus ferrireducens TaxID=2831190 RepID=UPI00207B99E2|nr:hydrogenobyrinic acid a,c-diamide synthase (glutamine-hydrolyzing) [Desulfovulcanus ferrireducens]